VRKADVGVQPTVIHQEQFSAVLYKATSATQTIQTVPVELFVIMVQELVHAVRKPMAATPTRTVDSAVLHSGPVIQTVHVLHSITPQFLQECLPVKVL
jgi:hypothetical protein